MVLRKYHGGFLFLRENFGGGEVISERFDRAINNMSDKLSRLSEDKRQELEKNLDVDDMEMMTYQNWQAEAHAMGLITPEEAQFLYSCLGGELPSSSAWNKLDLVKKIFVTQMMGELGKRLGKGTNL
jgi:hypothetical protein